MESNFFYKILDLSPGASEEDIRKAYRKKAKLYHPDVNKSPDAHAKFVLITTAYETLIDAARRFNYDHQQRQKAAHDPFKAYNDWLKAQKAKAEYEARVKYDEFVRNREKFRNSYLYYPTLIFIYIATAFCYLLGVGIIGLCSFLIFKTHIIWIFFLSPFICAGVYFLKQTGEWYKEAKKYF